MYYGFYNGGGRDKDYLSYSVNNLPNQIKEVYLGGSFNNSIDNLPDSVEKLYIGDDLNDFNQIINKLPSNLKFLNIVDFTHYHDKIDKKLNHQVFKFCDKNKLKELFPTTRLYIFDWEKIGYRLSCNI